MPSTKIFFNKRLKTLLILAAVAGTVVAFRLIDIQVIRHKDYLEIAERNRTQVIAQVAPRGRIFTSDGKAVATNAPSFNLYYLVAGPQDAEYLQQLAKDIAPRLNMTTDEVLDKVYSAIKSGKATSLAENLSTKSTMALQELQFYYPGIYPIEETKRNYPYESFASHLIGYIGSMDNKDWRRRDMSLDYRLNSKIGKNGIEKKFEKDLKGRDGGIYLEVDYRGRVRSIIQDRKWVAGSDIYLTLDYDLQKAAEEGLKNSKTGRGAVVALDPRNGAVLALASAPAYDPNIFVPYSDEENKNASKKISEYNLAIQGLYPPASPFKIITAIAAIEEGNFDTERTIYCPGHYDAGSRVFKCWSRHGPVNFWGGMAGSCDVYFYTVASQIGAAAIERVQRMFMFGRLTGIDMVGEKAGNLYGPTRRARNKSYWFIGDTLNLSIGQGELLVTPIKMAQFMAAVASRGKVWRPYYIEKIVSNQTGKVTEVGEPLVLQEVPIAKETFDLIWKALKNTTDTGTAGRARIKGLEVYAKTGTAQNPHGEDHGWFSVFAGREGEEPTIAFAVFVEFGEGGASAAGPIAREMLKAYFDIKDAPRPVRRAVATPTPLPLPEHVAVEEIDLSNLTS